MDPVTAVGLAAGCLNLVRLAASTCQSIYRLQSALKQAPRDIQRLADDAETLQALLVEVERSGREADQIQLSSELQSAWHRVESQLREDLDILRDFVQKFEYGHAGSGSKSRSRVLAQIRHAISGDDILKLRRALKTHIGILNFINSTLTSRQIISLRDEFDFLKGGLQVIREIAPPIETARIFEIQDTHLMPATSNTVLPLKDLYGPAEKRQNYEGDHWKRVYWKWSIYRVAVWAFTIEASKSVKSRTRAHSGIKRFKLIFKFEPPKWLMDRLLQVSYDVFLDGHSLPYWQRTKCGCLSVIPMDVLSKLEVDDYFAAAECLLRVPFSNILLLVKMKKIWGQYAAFDQIPVGLNCPYLFIFTLLHQDSHSRWRPRPFFPLLMYAKYGPAPDDFNEGDFIGCSPSFQQVPDLLLAYIYRNFTCHRRRPRFGFSTSQEAYEGFVHYIGQHWDPQSILELPRIDRWWLSALIYADSRYEAFLRSHLRSFRSYGSPKTDQLEIPKELRYSEIVREVLQASVEDRLDFMYFLCVFGSKKMLSPLIFEKVNWETEEYQNMFLQGAVLSGNGEVFEMIVEALEGGSVLEKCLHEDLLYRFLGNPFLRRQDEFTLKLLDRIPLTNCLTNQTLSRAFRNTTITNHDATLRLLADNSTRHVVDLFDASVLFIHQRLDQRLSDVASLFTAIDWGLGHIVRVFPQFRYSTGSSSTSLLEALAVAEKNCLATHPREATVAKAQKDTHPLIATVRLVSEDDDIECCLLLINKIKSLKVFPEDRFLRLLQSLAEKLRGKVNTLQDGRSLLVSQFLNDVPYCASQTSGAKPIEQELGDDSSGIATPEKQFSQSSPTYLLPTLSFYWVYPLLQHAHARVLHFLRLIQEYILSCLAQLRNMTALDALLLVVGVSVITTALIEHMLWELFVWIYHIPRPNNAALIIVAGLLIAGLWIS